MGPYLLPALLVTAAAGVLAYVALKPAGGASGAPGAGPGGPSYVPGTPGRAPPPGVVGPGYGPSDPGNPQASGDVPLDPEVQQHYDNLLRVGQDPDALEVCAQAFDALAYAPQAAALRQREALLRGNQRVSGVRSTGVPHRPRHENTTFGAYAAQGAGDRAHVRDGLVRWPGGLLLRNEPSDRSPGTRTAPAADYVHVLRELPGPNREGGPGPGGWSLVQSSAGPGWVPAEWVS